MTTERGARRQAESAGRLAETATAALLLLHGLRPLARRLRTPLGEIDLIARRGKLLVFVEVKLRRRQEDAAEAVTMRARKRTVAAARWWLAKHPAFARYTIRFDVVLWTPWSRPRHIVNAFDAGPF